MNDLFCCVSSIRKVQEWDIRITENGALDMSDTNNHPQREDCLFDVSHESADYTSRNNFT